MAVPRYDMTATRLADGKVLVVGGDDDQNDRLASAEVYDPATGLFNRTGSMYTARIGQTSTLLPDGRVLVAGGDQGQVGPDQLMLASAELYDPATGKFRPTGSMTTPRTNHTATLLPDGRVLVAGGYNVGHGPLASAELYDPATGRFSTTGSMAVARNGAMATLLADGRVLVVGGTDGPVTTAEIYDPATGIFSAAGSMLTQREGFALALLHDGRVLVVGGSHGGTGALTSAEIYWP